MPTYTDEFRQRACLALTVAGYPQQYGALISISRLLNVPVHTLKRWFHQSVATTMPQMTQPMLLQELHSIFAALDRKRDSASYADLSRALSQLVDTLHHIE